MINHVRTLLLNLDGSTSPGVTYPAEEFVPPDFRPLTLREPLRSIRDGLFGTDPDRAFLNCRLRQALTLVHAGELAAYATALDPRVTYWPPHGDKLFRALTFGAAVEQTAGTTLEATIQGTLVPANRLYHVWDVQALSGTSAQVTRATAPGGTTTVNFTVSGLSTPIPLGQGLSLVLSGTPSGSPLQAWKVVALCQPATNLSQALAAMRQAGLDEQFVGSAEPWPTFRNLWQEQYLPFTLRMGLAALALAHRLDEVYRGA